MCLWGIHTDKVVKVPAENDLPVAVFAHGRVDLLFSFFTILNSVKTSACIGVCMYVRLNLHFYAIFMTTHTSMTVTAFTGRKKHG